MVSWHLSPCWFDLVCGMHLPCVRRPVADRLNVSVIDADSFRLNENVVPTGGFFCLRLIFASLLPSRQADADCFKREIDGPLAVVNVAATARSALIARSHVLVPLQAPLHPANAEPACAVAVNTSLC